MENNFELLHTALYAKGFYKSRRILPDKFMPLYYDRKVVNENDEYSIECDNQPEREYDNTIRGIWWDLAKLLTVDLGDKYFVNFYAKSATDKIIPDIETIIHFLIKKCEPLFNQRYKDNVENNPLNFLILRREINKFNCHKYGYYFKGDMWWNWNNKKNVNDYDPDEALMWYILSNLSSIEIKYTGQLPKPDFKNVLPRRTKLTDKILKKFWD